VVGLFVVSQGAQPGDDYLLRVGLARIDDVENIMRMAEGWGAGIVALAGGDPGLVAVGMFMKTPVMKVAVEEAELPKMMRNVFADISNRAGGAHDNFCFSFFGRFFRRCFRIFSGGFRFCIRGAAIRRELHHPAAGILS
jgi:hypothetical protein